MALRKKKINKPAKVPAERKFFILWSPQSGKPPKIRFTRKKAEEVADIMVKKYHQEFFVMQSVSLHRPGVPERIPYSGREAKQSPIKEQFKEQAKTARVEPNSFANAGAAWDEYQDRRLRRLFMGRNSLGYMATAMGRTKLAIAYRLEHLGLKDRGSWDEDITYDG